MSIPSFNEPSKVRHTSSATKLTIESVITSIESDPSDFSKVCTLGNPAFLRMHISMDTARRLKSQNGPVAGIDTLCADVSAVKEELDLYIAAGEELYRRYKAQYVPNAADADSKNKIERRSEELLDRLEELSSSHTQAGILLTELVILRGAAQDVPARSNRAAQNKFK